MTNNKKIVSIREIQRNYRGLINRVKKGKQPLYLGAHFQEEAVLLDVESYEQLKSQADKGVEQWGKVKETLNWIRNSNNKNNLSDFIYADRSKH